MTFTPATSMAEVLAALDRILEWAAADGNRAGYFAALYRDVTRRVEAGIRAGRFEDGERMERLDVIFANRYLHALSQYRSAELPSLSWGVAFRATASRSPLILQHLLLGINAHINLDLGIAAAETSPGDELPALRRDFDEITVLLGEMLDEVQERIGRVSPWLWVLDRVGARTDEQVFNFALARARAFAWHSARQLAGTRSAEREARIAITDGTVAVLGDRVRSPGFWIRPALSAVRLREPNDAALVIEALSA